MNLYGLTKRAFPYFIINRFQLVEKEEGCLEGEKIFPVSPGIDIATKLDFISVRAGTRQFLITSSLTLLENIK